MTKTASRAKPKGAKARANGRILTVKQLPKASYDAIHKLGRGERGPAMKALLAAWATSKHTVAELLGGDLKLVHKDG